MNLTLIPNLQKIAQGIDCRINIFEGYCPKSTTNAKDESLFWRKVTSIYGLFADCDSIQIKKTSNLFSLMLQYSFISRDDYEFIKEFWRDISALRKWFCHNTNASLFYQSRNITQIENYLNRAYLCSSVKPKNLEELKSNQWSLVNADIDRRFDEYLNILKKGLTTWEKSENSGEAVEDWIEIFSKSLFEDNELKENIIAEMAEFERRNYGLNSSLKLSIQIIKEELKEKGFSSEIVKNYIEDMDSYKSNKDIITEVIKQVRL